MQNQIKFQDRKKKEREREREKKKGFTRLSVHCVLVSVGLWPRVDFIWTELKI